MNASMRYTWRHLQYNIVHDSLYTYTYILGLLQSESAIIPLDPVCVYVVGINPNLGFQRETTTK